MILLNLWQTKLEIYRGLKVVLQEEKYLDKETLNILRKFLIRILKFKDSKQKLRY